MGQTQAAAGMDRLPWLADEPAPTAVRPGNRSTAAIACAATIVIAGVSYWMGAHSWNAQPAASSPQVTVKVPYSQPQRGGPADPNSQPGELTQAQPQVILEPAPDVSPAPQRDLPIATARVEPRSSAAPEPASAAVESAPEKPTAVAAPPAAKPVPAPAQPPAAWPAWESQGAAGRIIRIGAFGSRQQAKLGWRYMVRAYPAVAHLRATVVETRNSRGRTFYRFQIGTTSQAHSEVLCQWMEKIQLSCAVIGLPWKPGGVER